jgi:LuxR family maltose regulon positive regulatory protein
VVQSWLDLPRPPLQRAIVPSLAEAVTRAPPFVLVLDDVHLVRDPRCWAALWPILEAPGLGSTVVLCGRADPPLPLPRLRAEERVAEYRYGELVFDRNEVAELLVIRGLSATEDLVDHLLATAEGWAAGLYLMATALKRRGVPAGPPSLATAWRDIADYLTGEVLTDQPPEFVEFLTRTSIVDRLSPELCNALTGRSDGLDMLRRVEKENLFVARLDGDMGWYRYHHLFAELLAGELRRRDPGAVPELHRRAARWFEERDQVRQAVRHWLAAGELERAGDLVAARWISRYDTGRLLSARLWLDEFWPGQELAYPPLTIASAWVKALTGEPVAAGRLLARLDSAALDASSPDGTACLRSSVALVTAVLGTGGAAGMRRQADVAVALETGNTRTDLWLALATHLAGLAAALCGEDGPAVEHLHAAARHGSSVRSGIEEASLGHLSLIAGDEGRWHDAEDYALEATAKCEVYDLEDYLPSVPARMARDRLSARAGDADAVADLEELFDGLDWGFCQWLGPQIALILAEIALDGGDVTRAHHWLAGACEGLNRWSSPGLACRVGELERRLRERAVTEPVSVAERRVLELLATYLTVPEIATRLELSPNTVASHVRSLHRKLGATSRSATVERAVELGLLTGLPATPDD